MKKILGLVGMIMLSFALLASGAAAGRAAPEAASDTHSATPSSDAADEESPYNGLDAETVEIMMKQEPLIKAHNEFLSHLETDTDRLPIYPDTFAGDYIDNETYRLCMLLTDCSDEVVAEYNSCFSDPSLVYYIQAEYSYNDLHSRLEEVTEKIGNFTTLCVSQKENVIEVGVNEPSESERNRMRELFPADYPIKIDYAGYVQTH